MIFGSEAKLQIEEICDLILLGEKVYSAVKEAKSFKVECGEVGKQVYRLAEMLKTLFCFITSAHTAVYLRPIKCIVAEVKDNFKHAQDIVYKCKHQTLLRRVFFKSSNAIHFRKLLHHLDDSISDMQWLVTVYDPQSEAIDATVFKKSDTFLAWYYIATVQIGRQLEDRVKAAECLALLAQKTDYYKKIIFEEGGVPPLQKLLKENSSLDAQIWAANALCHLANEQEQERIIMKEMVSIIVNRLSRTSPVWDQTQAANLVASIAEHNPEVKEFDLITENVIWRLVTLLSSEPSTDDPRTNLSKLKLKITCSKALRLLAQGSLSNCRTLTETKGMLCLAKLVETEQGELQYNCLMIIREITAIAESNAYFRRSAFKSSSPAAKAVVDELLRVIKEFDDAKLSIPAIKSIGSLARSFSAKESPVVSPLVARLDNTDQEIAMEAAIALEKFVCTDNHLCSDHSKSIIEFNCVPKLMKLLSTGDKMSQRHGLALICFLAKHGGNSNVLIEAGALTALETTGRLVAAEDAKLAQLVSDAISELQSDQTDKHEELDSSSTVCTIQFITEQSRVGTLTALETTGSPVAAEDPGLKQLVSDSISEFQSNQTDKHEESDSSSTGSTKQWTSEQSRVVSDSLGRQLKSLLKGHTAYQPRLVNLQVHRKTSAIAMRCKKRFLQSIRSFRTRRVHPFLKAKSLELALRSVLDYPGSRLLMKEIAGMLKLVKKIVKSLKKKENRRHFGYMIHKFCVIVLCTYCL